MPELTVIIPTYQRGEEILACLEALASQSVAANGGIETILIDSSPDQTTVVQVRALHPSVKVIHSPERLLPQEARNLGAAESTAKVIAFTDSDCVPAPEWAEHLLAAHAEGATVVGGSINPGRGFSQLGRNICKFALWLEGLPPGERLSLPTANLSMTRATWEEIGPFDHGGYSGDTKLVWRAADAGLTLRFEPSAVVRHHEGAGLRTFLAERRERGHAFASMRSGHRTWSRLRAAGYALAGPLLFTYLFGRVLGLAIRSRGIRGAATAPLIGAGQAAWTWGEVRGYARHALRGPVPGSIPDPGDDHI